MALITAEVATDHVDWARRVIEGAETLSLGGWEAARIALGYAESCIKRGDWTSAHEFASDAIQSLCTEAR